MADNLTIIIPFFNGHSTIARLLKTIPQELPVIIVDDLSDKPLDVGTVAGDRKGIVTYLKRASKGYFAGAVNTGIRNCSTDVLVLNQDVWFETDECFKQIEWNRSRFAMIGERILGDHPAFGEFGYIHGTYMFLRRDAIEAVGLLNERDYPLWGNTAELQLRFTRKNFAVLPIPQSHMRTYGFRHERAPDEAYGSSIRTILQREPQLRSKLISTPPLVSVIVPCYNYGRFLSDCINSLIGGPTVLGHMPGQTLQSFEIIIVDDHSTDDSADEIRRLTDIRKGIRSFLLERNVGTAQALNFGIKRAVGKYITFLSADDMREPESLEDLVRTCQENPHSFAYDDVWIFNKQRKQKWKLEEYDFESLLHKNHIPAGIMYPKIAWEEVGGYPAIMTNGREDWAFNVALGIKGWCGVHVHKFGYLYRREGQNRSLTNTTVSHRQMFADKLRSLFPDVYGGYRPMACCGRGGANNLIQTKKLSGKVQSFSLTGGRMASSSGGSGGMTKLQYTGSMQPMTWTGPVTYMSYRFGVGKTTGWVDNRDVGERGKSGMLNLKDNSGRYIFVLAQDEPQPVATEPVGTAVEPQNSGQEPDVTVQNEETVVALVEPALEDQESELVAVEEEPSTPKSQVDFPDPSNLTVTEIRALKLTKEQWDALYRAELAGLNRKGVRDHVEGILASWVE